MENPKRTYSVESDTEWTGGWPTDLMGDMTRNLDDTPNPSLPGPSNSADTQHVTRPEQPLPDNVLWAKGKNGEVWCTVQQHDTASIRAITILVEKDEDGSLHITPAFTTADKGDRRFHDEDVRSAFRTEISKSMATLNWSAWKDRKYQRPVQGLNTLAKALCPSFTVLDETYELRFRENKEPIKDEHRYQKTELILSKDSRSYTIHRRVHRDRLLAIVRSANAKIAAAAQGTGLETQSEELRESDTSTSNSGDNMSG